MYIAIRQYCLCALRRLSKSIDLDRDPMAVVFDLLQNNETLKIINYFRKIQGAPKNMTYIRIFVIL